MVLIAPLWNWNSLVLLSVAAREGVLIAPLWNWNPKAETRILLCAHVLIAPLWNWNMETHWIGWAIIRSNRTFMELKFGYPLRPPSVHGCSNRTFMELKCVTQAFILKQWRVLIAPLWNWNERYRLRSCGARVLIAPLWNWNHEAEERKEGARQF